MPIENINNTTPQDVHATNRCLDAFMRELNQELSVTCMLPHSLPKKELIRIIEQAKKWFYKNYEYSVEEKYMILSKELWTTEEFKKNSEIRLIDAVFSVTSVWQIGRDSGETALKTLFNNDPDFSIKRRVFDTQGGQLGLASDSLMHYVLAERFYDLSRQLLVNKMSYGFNYLTGLFRFLGEVPRNEVILQVYTKLDDCSLFKDEIFFRYTVAQAKVQLSRVLGTFNYNLPGNITINYDLIREEGKEELDRIREEIKGDEGTDYFFFS